MSHVYSDPSREADPHALPNIEIFWAAEGEMGREIGCAADNPAGFYWWHCFPGCLPDGDPVGPFETEAEAVADCRDQNA